MNTPNKVRARNVIPEFLEGGEAAEYLSLAPGTFANIRPFMHMLELPHKQQEYTKSGKRQAGNYLYPVTYLTLLRGSLRWQSGRSVVGPAEDFSMTPGARDAMVTAERNLDFDIEEMTLANDGQLTARELNLILGIERTTMNLWQRKGVAEITKSEVGRQPLQITADALARVLTWHRPDVYEPATRVPIAPLQPFEPWPRES
jgi:hypothetical protein